MKQKINDYIKQIEKEIDKKDIKSNPDDILTTIKFFQHERLVHLIVTVFAGISAILFLLGFIAFEQFSLLLLFIITICLFIPYIFHYYTLENGVQKLYDLYFIIKNKA